MTVTVVSSVLNPVNPAKLSFRFFRVGLSMYAGAMQYMLLLIAIDQCCLSRWQLFSLANVIAVYGDALILDLRKKLFVPTTVEIARSISISSISSGMSLMINSLEEHLVEPTL